MSALVAHAWISADRVSTFLLDVYSETIVSQHARLCTDDCRFVVLYGGTNWGQTLEPTVYSSYDYGGGINENRVATTKMNEMRLQGVFGGMAKQWYLLYSTLATGLFLRVARDLLGSSMIANGTGYTSSPLVYTTELRNSNTNGAFYVVRHNDAT